MAPPNKLKGTGVKTVTPPAPTKAKGKRGTNTHPAHEMFVTWGRGNQGTAVQSLVEAQTMMDLYVGLGREAVRLVTGPAISYAAFRKGEHPPCFE